MIIIVMGVSGSGKTTIGQMLADALNWSFSDADAFHSQANIEKMQRGIPLTDADRVAWLEVMQQAIAGWLQEGQNQVLACSALKVAYREVLWCNPDKMRLVYLKGSFELIENRLAQRQHHFMSKDLLRSQLDTLEEPKDAIEVDISEPPALIVKQIRDKLGV